MADPNRPRGGHDQTPKARRAAERNWRTMRLRGALSALVHVAEHGDTHEERAAAAVAAVAVERVLNVRGTPLPKLDPPTPEPD